jgi:UDP-galactopyranose mutase
MFFDIICLSHLRWNFVYQRPQHLLSRFSKSHRIFFIEEPVFDARADYNEISKDDHNNVWIVVPHVKNNLSEGESTVRQKILLDSLFIKMNITEYVLWYYSPLAIRITEHLCPTCIIYDCMDELSAFKFASPRLAESEAAIFKKADIVFTGGYSLYEAKKRRHQNIFPFPSSIDKEHFMLARSNQYDPTDQADIPHPRLGFYGVLDERLHIELINELACMRPNWHFILIGPVAKIDPAVLPKKDNIHYPGSKSYKELPLYLSGWDIAMMPFALNESTRFISPTKTPEFLAGGKPVISTSIQDVINPYGNKGLVHIADTASEFVMAAETILNNKDYDKWLSQVDAYLSDISWDKTWQHMALLIDEMIMNKNITKIKKVNAYV